jgi:hypothetical protein
MTDTSPVGRRTMLALAASATAFPLHPVRAQRGDIPISMLVPLSGPWARSGLLEKLGAEMAVEDVNQAVASRRWGAHTSSYCLSMPVTAPTAPRTRHNA